MSDQSDTYTGHSDRFHFAKAIAEGWGSKLADRLIADPAWPTCDQLKAVARSNELMFECAAWLNDFIKTGDLAPYAEMMIVVMMRSYRDALPNFAKKGD
jgi:hypothetical protein